MLIGRSRTRAGDDIPDKDTLGVRAGPEQEPAGAIDPHKVADKVAMLRLDSTCLAKTGGTALPIVPDAVVLTLPEEIIGGVDRLKDSAQEGHAVTRSAEREGQARRRERAGG